ncbi:MAG: glycosyltransferase [Conexivisphaerales archaeon]
MEEFPLVGIIVTAYNNGKTIVQTLSTLSAQTYPNKEIIVVCDNNSKDDTVLKVNDYIKNVKDARIVYCEGVGRSEARNIGWQNTSASIIMFADGDDLYEEEYISKAVRALQASPDYGGVCLGGTALVTTNSLLNKFYKSYGSTDERMPAGREPDWAWVYRRECLVMVKGYDESLDQGEDKDLCSRVKALGFRIAYVEGINWYHRKPETIRDLLKKEYFAGKRRVAYEIKVNKKNRYLFSSLAIVYGVMLLFTGYYAGATMSLLVIGLTIFLFFVYSSLRRKASTVTEVIGFTLLDFLMKISYTVGQIDGTVTLSLRKTTIYTRGEES